MDDLEDINVKLEDEDKAIILLNALPKSFKHIKYAMLFGRESTITLEEVKFALRVKELRRRHEVKIDQFNEGLMIKKSKNSKTTPFKKKKQSKGKEVAGQKETRKCYFCKKIGHLIKDCYAQKRKQQAEKSNKIPESIDVWRTMKQRC